MIGETEVKSKIEMTFEKYEADIAAAVTHMRQERDDAIEFRRATERERDQAIKDRDDLHKAVLDLEAERDRLRAALKPFVKVPYAANTFNRAVLVDDDFRRARAALESKP